MILLIVTGYLFLIGIVILFLMGTNQHRYKNLKLKIIKKKKPIKNIYKQYTKGQIIAFRRLPDDSWIVKAGFQPYHNKLIGSGKN